MLQQQLMDAQQEGKINEEMIKKMVREGENRKSSIEETRLLDCKVREMSKACQK